MEMPGRRRHLHLPRRLRQCLLAGASERVEHPISASNCISCNCPRSRRRGPASVGNCIKCNCPRCTAAVPFANIRSTRSTTRAKGKAARRGGGARKTASAARAQRQPPEAVPLAVPLEQGLELHQLASGRPCPPETCRVSSRKRTRFVQATSLTWIGQRAMTRQRKCGVARSATRSSAKCS